MTDQTKPVHLGKPATRMSLQSSLNFTTKARKGFYIFQTASCSEILLHISLGVKHSVLSDPSLGILVRNMEGSAEKSWTFH